MNQSKIINTIVSGILFDSPSAAMLSNIVHCLLLLPVTYVQPLMLDLLITVSDIDKLNARLPVTLDNSSGTANQFLILYIFACQ